MSRLALLALALLTLTSCRQGLGGKRRTCYVLSVGGSAGLAHLGALDALRERGHVADCVVGNSMGALVGSLYATAPDVSQRERYRAFVARYIDDAGLLARAMGMGLALVLGDDSPGVVRWVGKLLGRVLNVGASHRHLRDTLDAFYARADVQGTRVPFVTYYLEREGQGVRPVKADRGNLADAVAASTANPYVFRDLDTSTERWDPGTDRVSRVPVQDACDAFPGARLLALNVTGTPAWYTKDLPCEVHEVAIPVTFGADGDADAEVKALLGEGRAFDAAYRAGYDAMAAALDARGGRP